MQLETNGRRETDAASQLTTAWQICLAVPLVTAAAFFAAAVSAQDAPDWVRGTLFAPVIALPALWAALLAYLAIASDANASTASAQVVELERRSEPLRRAA